MHGIGNGPHTLEVVATDGAGSTLDLGPLLHLTFEVERGESLLGAMSKRVQAGDFRHLDSLSPPAAMALNEEDGADGQETEGSGVACADEDVTLVTAAINIGRRHGNISFEDDYIGNADKVVEVLLAYPKLLQRPVIVTADKAIIGRPLGDQKAKERLNDLFS